MNIKHDEMVYTMKTVKTHRKTSKNQPMQRLGDDISLTWTAPQPAAESHRGQDVTAPDRNVTVLLPKDGPAVHGTYGFWRFASSIPGQQNAQPSSLNLRVTSARFGVQYLRKTTMIAECVCGSVLGVSELLKINIRRVHHELG